MKTRLIFLVLLIVCFSCGTNNNPLSDAEKEKIRGEVKEVVNTFVKGCEEVNFDMVTESFLDSPEFGYITYGKTYSYDELMAMRPNYDGLLNQKCTLVDEKYTIIDNSTVIYSSNSKWVTNYKDGHSTLYDPDAFMFIFKKINSMWRVIYYVDSYVEKNVPIEISKGLNQTDLLKKFVGNWEIPVGIDTSLFMVIKNFKGGNGLHVSDKLETKEKVLVEGTGFWAYDAKLNKATLSLMRSNGEVTQNLGVFTSPTTYEYVNVNSSPSYTGVSKCLLEFISSDEIKGKFFIDNKEIILTWNRLKN